MIYSYAAIHFDCKDTKSNPLTRKISITNYISIISKSAWRFLVDSNVMKALFINGSPRKNGNTAQLLKRAMDGAREAGGKGQGITN